MMYSMRQCGMGFTSNYDLEDVHISSCCFAEMYGRNLRPGSGESSSIRSECDHQHLTTVETLGKQ